MPDLLYPLVRIATLYFLVQSPDPNKECATITRRGQGGGFLSSLLLVFVNQARMSKKRSVVHSTSHLPILPACNAPSLFKPNTTVKDNFEAVSCIIHNDQITSGCPGLGRLRATLYRSGVRMESRRWTMEYNYVLLDCSSWYAYTEFCVERLNDFDKRIAAVIRDTVYIDGGYLWWQPGLKDGTYGIPMADGMKTYSQLHQSE